MAADKMKPIRRVVTGNDAHGRSCVTWDGPTPNTEDGTDFTNAVANFWVWNDTPAPLSGEHDDANLPYDFPGPQLGGHLRAVQGRGKPADYDAATDIRLKPFHPPKERTLPKTWDRGGRNAYSSDMHKTETIDYAILLEGERTLVLDDVEVTWKPGDIIVDVGAWHQWTSSGGDGIVLYDMMAAKFVDGNVGLAQGNDKIMVGDPARKLPPGVKPARRIVCADREPWKSGLVSDAPTPDVRIDAARPGYAAQRMWVTDQKQAKVVLETLQLPHTIEPPSGGSVLRVVTYPPDAVWQSQVGSQQVAAFFRDMGSPQASTYSAQAPHPYMQKLPSLDFVIVLEGEIVLVLDTQEVHMRAGEIAIVRGNNHAWSNRSNHPAVVAVSSHGGSY